jgi:hypothetical protein
MQETRRANVTATRCVDSRRRCRRAGSSTHVARSTTCMAWSTGRSKRATRATLTVIVATGPRWPMPRIGAGRLWVPQLAAEGRRKSRSEARPARGGLLLVSGRRPGAKTGPAGPLLDGRETTDAHGCHVAAEGLRPARGDHAGGRGGFDEDAIGDRPGRLCAHAHDGGAGGSEVAVMLGSGIGRVRTDGVDGGPREQLPDAQGPVFGTSRGHSRMMDPAHP